MSSQSPFSLPVNGGQPPTPQNPPTLAPQTLLGAQPAGNPYYSDPQQVTPQQGYDDPYGEYDDSEADGYDGPEAVFWNVEGWSPDQPFTGEIVFTDEQGNYLLSIPVEPEAMRSLNDITGQVLETQYAAFGQSRPGSPQGEPAEQAESDGRKVIQKDIAGVPLRMTVNTKSLGLLGVLAGIVVVIMIIALFNG